MVLLSVTTAVLAILLQCHGASAHAIYMTYIPNGVSVPDPCHPGNSWHGVGHLAPGGGGPRNKFGKDFADAGHRWTTTLCQADSDGDGQSNGKELGDPDCTWGFGKTPSITTGITHPGINNDSPGC